jgi:hypothetical protein
MKHAAHPARYPAVAAALAAVVFSFAAPPAQARGVGSQAPHPAPQAVTPNHSQPTMLGPTHPTGQPNQSCGSATAPFTPGNAANAPGSAFNPNGKAGTVYAGEQPQNSRNVASVSQYDVACANQKR